MESSGYEVIKHRLACENIYYSVYFDTISKDGKVLVEDYLSVELKANFNEKITGSLVLPIRNEKFGLLKIYRHPIRDYSWELPGGFIDQGESPLLCAKRELEEEAGLICQTKDLTELGSFYPASGLVAGKICIFSADKCEPVSENVAPEFGITQFKWFSLEEIEENIENGIIQDMATVLAIHRRISLYNKKSTPPIAPITPRHI